MTDIELEQFITEYGGDIYSFCCCLTGSRQEADDLYQETFLRAIEKKQILDAEGNPKSYLLSGCGKISGGKEPGGNGLPVWMRLEMKWPGLICRPAQKVHRNIRRSEKKCRLRSEMQWTDFRIK